MSYSNLITVKNSCTFNTPVLEHSKPGDESQSCEVAHQDRAVGRGDAGGDTAQEDIWGNQISQAGSQKGERNTGGGWHGR